MAETGVDGMAALSALAERAGVLMAECAVKDVQIAQLQQRLAEAQAEKPATT